MPISATGAAPNIDVRLESFYGQQGTPSRAALVTGRYPMRQGLQTLVVFPSHTYGLPLDERTLPQALKEAGYTTLMVGKWHLGHAHKKPKTAALITSMVLSWARWTILPASAGE